MAAFLLGLVLFLGVHSVAIVATPWRARQISMRGIGPWKAAYAVIAAVGLVLLIAGYGWARQSAVVLYTPAPWLRHLALLVMLPVFPLLFAAYLPGRIRAATRHPMLLAVKLWATAHLLANGTLVDVILFASFLAWAVADRVSIKGRRQERHDIPAAPPGRWNDAIALVGGLATYAFVLFWAHAWLIGVSPLAPR